MSLRAELVRLGLRWLAKGSNRAGLTLGDHRKRLARFERWVPEPPSGSEIRHCTLGGVAAVRIVAPGSHAGRHLLFLHGGGYVSGSPQLYRHITWRFAAAAA